MRAVTASGSIAEFLFEHFGGSGCSEAFETHHFVTTAHHGPESGGKTACQAELRHSGRKYTFAILRSLLSEKTCGGNRHHAGPDTLCLESLGCMHKQSDIAAVGNEHYVGIFSRNDHITAVCRLSLPASRGGSRREDPRDSDARR